MVAICLIGCDLLSKNCIFDFINNYGAPDEKRGFSHFAPKAFHPKTEIISGILGNECAILMTNFFKQKR
jgi:hypothetical protein